VALELIRRAGVPIAAPSANRFGHTSPTTAAHVLDDLDGRIDAVLDAGPAEHGVESTVLDPNLSPMAIYRPGAVTSFQIQDTAGPVELYLPQPFPVSIRLRPCPRPVPAFATTRRERASCSWRRRLRRSAHIWPKPLPDGPESGSESCFPWKWKRHLRSLGPWSIRGEDGIRSRSSPSASMPG